MLESMLSVLPQVLLDGLVLGFVYAMISLGYTMVYGVLELINFAHSDVFMVGCVVGIEVFRYFGRGDEKVHGLNWNPWLVLIIAFIMAAAIAGGVNVLAERLAYRPIRARGGASSLIPMITTIGVSFIIQDVTRLIEALWHNQFFLQFSSAPVLDTVISFPPGADFPVISISVKQIVVIVVSIIMLTGLLYLVNRTKLGTAIRAVAQDRMTSSLMGINPDQIISRTFLIGGAMAGVGGVLWAMVFPTVSPYVGFIPGLKAFTAAVLGGIGNLTGAMVGGLVLAQLETLAGTYLPVITNNIIGTEYKDVIAFVVLIVLLLFRPQGLLGQQVSEKV